MVRRALPPGFRFHPTDVELILYYLKRKIMGMKFHYEAIGEVNIYKYSPWDLPDKSHLKSKDLEWFFFCPREKNYASGVRVKRATENGYWKTTGKDRNIFCNNRTVGTVRTLIFHLGHAPQGERTNWVIHEYRILDDQLAKDGVQDNYVLCKVFEKKGPGPKNGAQYGAPFNEADWADDIDDDVAQSCSVLLEADGPCPLVLMQNEEQRLPVGTGLFVSGNGSLPIPEEVPSSSAVAPASMVADETTNGEMERLLGSFADEDMLLSNSNGLNQDDNGDKMNKPSPFPEGLDLYNDLHDLDIWNEMKQDRFIFSGMEYVENSLNSNLPNDNSTYIELNDLLPPLDFAKEVTGTHLLAPCQLDCSNGVTGTQLSSLCQASASYSNENMQQLYSETRFSGMNQYKNFSANGLALPAYTFEGDDSFDALQIVDHQFYQGTNNAPYNLDSQFEDAVYNPDNIMERGSRIENSNTRFMECVPSAAAELLALLPCTCGGSSMHIKAEVTRECTNDAFSVMMEGSSSCWCCNFLFQLWLIKGLFIVVEFVCDFIMVCCLNERSNLFTPIAETGNLGYLLTCYYFQKHNYMLSHYFYCQLFILIAS